MAAGSAYNDAKNGTSDGTYRTREVGSRRADPGARDRRFLSNSASRIYVGDIT